MLLLLRSNAVARARPLPYCHPEGNLRFASEPPSTQAATPANNSPKISPEITRPRGSSQSRSASIPINPSRQSPTTLACSSPVHACGNAASCSQAKPLPKRNPRKTVSSKAALSSTHSGSLADPVPAYRSSSSAFAKRTARPSAPLNIECASSPNPRYGFLNQYFKLCFDRKSGKAKFEISYWIRPAAGSTSHARSYSVATRSSEATAGACSRAPPPKTSRPSRDSSSISSMYTLRCSSPALVATCNDRSQLSTVWYGSPAIRSAPNFRTPAVRSRANSAMQLASVCVRPTACASRSTKLCTPRLTRFTPKSRAAASSPSPICPGAASIVISAPASTRNSPRIADITALNCAGSNKLGVPPPKYIVSTRSGSSAPISRARLRADRVSAQSSPT